MYTSSYMTCSHENIVTYYRVTVDQDWIFDLLTTHTQLVIPFNYSPIADFYTLQITTAHARRFLLTASNNGYSSTSVLKSCLNDGSFTTACYNSFLHRLPYRTDSVSLIVFLITPRHGPSRKHLFQQYL
jgi:hypothetical protein